MTKMIAVFLIILGYQVGFSQTDSLLIERIDGSLLSYNLNDVQDLSFSEVWTDVEVERVAGEILTEFSLKQNYPNPFNPTTTIEYQLPISGEVRIVIYDLLGKAVRYLYTGVQPPGVQQIVWDGKAESGIPVSSGNYFCQVTFNGYSLTKRMIVLK